MPLDRAVFLDRDGTINRNQYYPDSGEFEGPRSADDFELYPWAIPALTALKQAGYCLLIVSNQPNFGERYVKCRCFRVSVPPEAVSTGRGAS